MIKELCCVERGESIKASRPHVDSDERWYGRFSEPDLFLEIDAYLNTVPGTPASRELVRLMLENQR